jgi:hypothetical protein
VSNTRSDRFQIVPLRRLPRTLVLLVLPLLLGGFLLMHGVEATSTGGGHVAASAVDSHTDQPESGEHHHGATCPDCWGHALAACVAVIVGLVTLRLTRRWVAVARSALPLPTGVRLVRERWEQWHPPEPAWVRLAVMRC